MTIQDFFSYFFGKGTEIEFTNFSLAHFLPIVLMLAVIFATYRYRDRIRDWKREESLRLFLAFALIITEMSYFWRLVGVPTLQPNPVDHLPITVCGWALIFSSYMVISKNQTLFFLKFRYICKSLLAYLVTYINSGNEDTTSRQSGLTSCKT